MIHHRWNKPVGSMAGITTGAGSDVCCWLAQCGGAIVTSRATRRYATVIHDCGNEAIGRVTTFAAA